MERGGYSKSSTGNWQLVCEHENFFKLSDCKMMLNNYIKWGNGIKKKRFLKKGSAVTITFVIT